MGINIFTSIWVNVRGGWRQTPVKLRCTLLSIRSFWWHDLCQTPFGSDLWPLEANKPSFLGHMTLRTGLWRLFQGTGLLIQMSLISLTLHPGGPSRWGEERNWILFKTETVSSPGEWPYPFLPGTGTGVGRFTNMEWACLLLSFKGPPGGSIPSGVGSGTSSD